MDNAADVLAHAAFARAWAKAVVDTAGVPLSQTGLENRLNDLVESLAHALATDPPDAGVAREVGAALVDAELVKPEALGRTLDIVGRTFGAVGALGALGALGMDGPEFPRLINCLAEIAVGYADALQDRTFRAQEGMLRAALQARTEAERALKESEARYRHLSLHDPLTGLPNRTLLDTRLRAVFDDAAAGARVGVCFVDLDRFKVVNDTLGHEIGDRLLVEVAGRLDCSISTRGHLLARWGGDEFVVLIPDSTGLDQVTAVADAVLTALADPVRIDGHRLPMSASIGVIECPVADTEPGELLRAADITLYWAKADGGGRWALFDRQRNAGQVGRYALAAAVPIALRKDQFDVVYQPIVDLHTGEVSGVEALARWRHPDLGMLGPDQFIALAEENAHIVPLGRRILERACQQARQWHDQIRHDQIASTPYMSVNLAVLQTRDPGLVEDVSAIVGKVGLPPGLLQLEITESALMDTDENALTVLRKLVDLGVRLVLDDFGTGYSNLAYLGKLPICGMKLAGCFAARVESPDPVNRRILAAVVNLAHEAGLEVTAECVETPTQARHLGLIGCDTGQGWLFGRPVPGDDLPTLVGRGSPEAAPGAGVWWGP